MNITWVGSPNYTNGRNGTTIDRIVIHWADGTLATADQVFQDTTRDTSAHYGIEDNEVHQYVREENTAYHSGDWPMNLRSIGIEHSAQPGRDASDLTYHTSAELIAGLSQKYSIPLDREHIIKHCEVVPTQCPGTIDIDKIISLAQGVSMEPYAVDENFSRAIFADYYGENNPTDDQIQSLVGEDWRVAINNARHSEQYTQRKAYVKALEKNVKVLQEQVSALPTGTSKDVVDKLNEIITLLQGNKP